VFAFLQARDLKAALDVASLPTVGQPMLQLVAAWDQLAAALPPGASRGHAADLLPAALKLALGRSSPRAAARALALAQSLAELAGTGDLPIDAEAIAAASLSEALSEGTITLEEVSSAAGPAVAQLARDVLKVRGLPHRADLCDDESAAALRELCLAFYDVRATAVEVVARAGALVGAACLAAPVHERQAAALEGLQIYAPLGHALGMGRVSARLEDACFQALFPASYEATAAWLHRRAPANEEALARCGATLADAVCSDARFSQLASGVEVRGRTKSLFSVLKKLLRLGDTARGGRALGEIYDLLGLRAVVLPREDLPPEEAEEAATQACYMVLEAAEALWAPVEGRTKDYVRAPKSNGYRSLHCTLRLRPGEGGSGIDAPATLELQIRTRGERSSRSNYSLLLHLLRILLRFSLALQLLLRVSSFADYYYATLCPLSSFQKCTTRPRWVPQLMQRTKAD
jgi:GTP pyrophosphokinase